MYNIDQLENLLKCTYPAKVSIETQIKRLKNIQAIQQLIENAIRGNALAYQVKEERLHIFTTQAGEKIYIQYPGKESVLTGTKRCPYDFRPRIMTASGQMIRDLVFADMWGLVENLNSGHHRMLKLMAAIFFRLGRMTFHGEVEKEYGSERLDVDGSIISSSSHPLRWFEFGIDYDIMESLNFHAGSLDVDGGTAISLEAFLCFFELLLQNEDIKYFTRKGNLTSGRIPTSDSMLLLSATLFGQIKLSVLLQRFVSGFGVAHCAINEIGSATDGMICIVDRKQELIQYYRTHNISYRVGSYISIHGNQYHAILKTNLPKIAILSTVSVQANMDLTSAGWTVYDLNSLTENAVYDSLIAQYEG